VNSHETHEFATRAQRPSTTKKFEKVWLHAYAVLYHAELRDARHVLAQCRWPTTIRLPRQAFLVSLP
jgi:hypothetical protein